MATKQTRIPKAKLPKPVAVIREFFIENTLHKIRIKSTDKTITIYLHLHQDRSRLIGTVTKSTRTIFMKRKRGVHLFRKGDAYGFNDYILREAKHFDTIALSDDFSNWKIPVKFILENGRYLTFQKQGFERQRFVSLAEIEQFRILPSENRRF